jgi:GxxExxY protein
MYNNKEYPHQEETQKIIGAAFDVHKTLGNGFLESVYQEVLAIEFNNRDIPYESEKEIIIYYNGIKLNKTFKCDFICHDKINIELKAVNKLMDEHYSQLLNYLKATGLQIGLLINFGAASLEFKRVINNFKIRSKSE